MRILRARTAPLSLALLPVPFLATLTGCERLTVVARPSTVRVILVFDPDPNRIPANCSVLLYTVDGMRIGDVPDGLAADASVGDESTAGSQARACPSRGETFTFPDNGNIKQGVWRFRADVMADGAILFSGACPAVTARSGKVHEVTFTQPPSGTTATCTFSLGEA